MENVHAPIEVQNLSKSGIGFATDSVLPIGYYFNARLEFKEMGESLHCVVRIVRQVKGRDGRNFLGG